MSYRTIGSLAALTACGGAEEPTEEPVESYACVHVNEGDVLDVALDRAEAREITVGRDPYRINLFPGEAGYVAFSTPGPASLVALVDFVGAVPAVWNGDDRVPLDPGAPNPNCDEDLPEVLYFDVPSGETTRSSSGPPTRARSG